MGNQPIHCIKISKGQFFDGLLVWPVAYLVYIPTLHGLSVKKKPGNLDRSVSFLIPDLYNCK